MRKLKHILLLFLFFFIIILSAKDFFKFIEFLLLISYDYI
jgi:hypothetical protein